MRCWPFVLLTFAALPAGSGDGERIAALQFINGAGHRIAARQVINGAGNRVADARFTDQARPDRNPAHEPGEPRIA